jgi:hypothetical protein
VLADLVLPDLGGHVRRHGQIHEDVLRQFETQRGEGRRQREKECDQERSGRPQRIEDPPRLVQPHESHGDQEHRSRNAMLQVDAEHAPSG